MNIAVIGTGYVGLVTGVCLAHAGHQVTCVDIDFQKIERMRAGEVPIYEPGLEPLFRQVQKNGKLQLTTNMAEAVAKAQAVFLALPTPAGANGAADLSAVLAVASELGPLLQHYTVIINKSTVPVGTGEQVRGRIAEHASADFAVVSNPEFLREGFAVEDFMHPDRIVIGTGDQQALKVMRELYQPFVNDDSQFVCMDIHSAEMTKYAANSFLAMKISFMNEVANLCELVGADVDEVRLGIGPDSRIGSRFLYAGIGYGGSCFPKDVQALQYTAQQADYDFKLINSVIDINYAQRQRLVDKVLGYFGDDVTGKHFAIWGLAFKPDTDDIREAPSLDIIAALLDAGASVSAYDPHAMANVQAHFGEHPRLKFAPNEYEALLDADALLIVTEWSEFRSPDFEAMRLQLKQPVIFDGRNMYDLEGMRQLDFYYNSIGRPVLEPGQKA